MRTLPWLSLACALGCSRGDAPHSNAAASEGGPAALLTTDAAVDATDATDATESGDEDAEGPPLPATDRAPAAPPVGQTRTIVGRFLSWRPLVIEDLAGTWIATLDYVPRAHGGQPSNLHFGDAVVAVIPFNPRCGNDRTPAPTAVEPATLTRLTVFPTSLTTLEELDVPGKALQLRPVTRPLAPLRRVGSLAQYRQAGHFLDVFNDGTVACAAPSISSSITMAAAELDTFKASLRAIPWPRRPPAAAPPESVTFVDGSLSVLPLGATSPAAVVEPLRALEARCLARIEIVLHYRQREQSAPGQRLDVKPWPSELGLRLADVSPSGTPIPTAEYASNKAFYDLLPSSEKALRRYRDGDVIYTSPWVKARKR